MIEIIPVINSKELKKFVSFPFQLYKDCSYWVPPLIKDEMETLDKSKNPVFKNADAWYYLAKKDGKLAGRIAVIINHIEVEEIGKKKVRFGWFDPIDDINVTKALLEKVIEHGKENSLEYMEGPVGFSNMEKAGILTMGFEELNTMITWYHFPYYAEHFEKLCVEKQATWVEYKMSIPPSIKEKVATAIERALSKNPDARFETCSDFARQVLRGRSPKSSVKLSGSSSGSACA